MIGGVFCSYFFKDLLIFLLIITADDEMAKKKHQKDLRDIDLVKNFGGLFFRIIRIIFCVVWQMLYYRSELGFFLNKKRRIYIFVFVLIFYVFEKGMFLDFIMFFFKKSRGVYYKKLHSKYTTLLDFSSILLSFKRKKTLILEVSKMCKYI